MFETRAMGNRRASERDVRIKGRRTFMVEREAVVVPEAGLHARPGD